jgi:prepilin-type N-terminal cleavage/methylation domain-containing protein
MKQRNTLFKKSGYTLIELLVVVAITGLLSGVGIVNYREIREVNRLLSDTSIVMEAIRSVQNKALAPNPGEISGFPANHQICAYGVYFENQTNTVKIYYVSTNPSIRPCGSTLIGLDFASGSLLKEYVLKDDKGSPSSQVSLSSGSNISLWFTTPFARGGSNRITSTGGTFDIRVSNARDLLIFRVIRISPSGLVRVMD